MPSVHFTPATSQHESPSADVDDASSDSGSSGASTPTREAPPVPERPAFLKQMQQGASAPPRANFSEQAITLARGNVAITFHALNAARSAYGLAQSNGQLTPRHERALTSAELTHHRALERLRQLMTHKTDDDRSVDATPLPDRAFEHRLDAEFHTFTAEQSTAQPPAATRRAQATGPHATPSETPQRGNRPTPAHLTHGPGRYGITAGGHRKLQPEQQLAMVNRIMNLPSWDDMDSLELCHAMNDLCAALGLGQSRGLHLQGLLSRQDIDLKTRHGFVDAIQAELNTAIVQQFDTGYHNELRHTVASLSDELRLGADGALDNMESLDPQRITRIRL